MHWSSVWRWGPCPAIRTLSPTYPFHLISDICLEGLPPSWYHLLSGLTQSVVYHKPGISVRLYLDVPLSDVPALGDCHIGIFLYPLSRQTNIATCHSSSLTIPGSSSFVSSSLSTYSHLGQCHCDAIPFVFTSLLSQLQVFKITLSIFNCQSKCRESANLAKEFQWLSF